MRKRIQDKDAARDQKEDKRRTPPGGTDRRRPENRTSSHKDSQTIKGKPFGKNDPFKKDGFKPREPRTFEKKAPGSNDKRDGFKPREARSWDKKPFGSDNRNSDKKDGGFKPREPRSFDRKPAGSDNGNGGKRDGAVKYGESRSFGQKDFGDKRPGHDRERDFKPRESGSFEKKPFENRSSGKFPGKEEKDASAFKPKDFQEKNTGKTGTKPAFFKGNVKENKAENTRDFEARREKLSENRQTGLAHAPRYDEDRMKKQLPPKVLKKIGRDDKDDTVRLNRYIANAGLCSRREADEFISSGQITVNGKVVAEMGYKVQPGDVVKYGRKILNREKIVYVLLNKPKDFITTTEDPEDRKTVMELVAKACEERIYPVGRLDRMTTGLLLLTNDGELADKLSHPSNGIKKVYQVELNKPIAQEHFDVILAGIELEDGMVKADDLAIITPDAEVVGIEIHSGKNRIVRRIFEHLGYEVMKLDRTTYAGLTKKDLPRGKWRFLTEKEVIRLKYMI